MAKKFAVLLSGCGYQDGSEIHEATMSLLAIKRAGCTYQCFAPNVNQHAVKNHLTGEEKDETRNVLEESARIARGDCLDLADYRAEDYDILLMPGGFGAALNLCTFGVDGPECDVHPEVKRAVVSTHEAGKPIGALCIAPVLLGKLLDHVRVTVGQDVDVNAALRTMGAIPENTQAEDVIVDRDKKIVTGPCYMLDSNIIEIAQGAQNVVNALLKFD